MKILFFLLIPLITFSQVNFPTAPQSTQFQNYGKPNFGIPTNRGINIENIIPDPMRNYNQQQQNQNDQLMREVEQYEKQKIAASRQLKKEIQEFNSENDGIDYNLPNLENRKGTEFYRNTFDKMLTLNVENFSVKEVNFDIENAYFENTQNKEEFNKIIKQTGEFLIAKMKELNYDTNSNSAKNYMLFQYFSETLQLKGFKEKHFPITYDFEDYRGEKDWSKMFVTKLLRTTKGQCHSMPLLYLTLAEEIGAEAFLSICPNHSYIKFQDEDSKWYNVELTNGMFTASSFILNSGYIKAEAMQNNIYMQNFSKKELLSQLYTDLAMGYIHKFGYDQFVEKTIKKALDLYPNNINANMVIANYDIAHLEFVAKKLNFNPRNKQELQEIKKYPQAMQLLEETNNQYQKIDDLGFQQMPADAYEKWLGSLKQTKNKQDDETFKKQFKGIIIKKTKN